MRKYIILISVCFFSSFSFGQNEKEEKHAAFSKYLKDHKIDSLYNSYLKVKKGDPQYEKALLYRNQYGWALNELEQLEKDIPALLTLITKDKQMSYSKVFQPQKFPPFEWDRFYNMSVALDQHFDTSSIEHREMLGVRTQLEFLTGNDLALKTDLPKLLKLLSKDSDAYSSMLWQYGNLQLRIATKDDALATFEKGWNQTGEHAFLESIVQLHSKNKDYVKVIQLEKDILIDSLQILFFNLGEAYSQKNDIPKAKKYFDLFSKQFKFIDYEPYVQIESNDIVYDVAANQLETLGEFYSDKSKIRSCEYYQYASKIVHHSKNEERMFQKKLSAMTDEQQKKDWLEKYEEKKKERTEFSDRIDKKLAACH